MNMLADALSEDRRLIILRALQEATGMTLNETILKMCCHNFGHRIGRDEVRTEMEWLGTQRLVRVEKLNPGDGEFWVAHLTTDGLEVAEGRPHHGVKRRAPG